MKNAADLKADTKGQGKYLFMQNLEDISPAKSDKAKKMHSTRANDL